MPLLEVMGVTKRFGGIVANADVSLRVGEWEIVGLIGPNGAGKTTLFNCVAGVYPPNAGRVTFRGEDITGLKTHERAGLGIGRSFQNLGLVRGQSVIQNLITAQHMLARYSTVEGMLGAPASFSTEAELLKRAEQILEYVRLTSYRNEKIDDLPYGVLKNVELATVLATDPVLLMLDEPSSGLSPTETDQLGDILLDLRKELGVTILMIEHHVPLVVRVCDYVYVLNFGTLLTEGPPKEVQQHPDVIAAYLGGEVTLNGKKEGAKGAKAKSSRAKTPSNRKGKSPPGYASPEGSAQYVPFNKE